MKRFDHRKLGFTLTEVAIATLIVAILTAVMASVIKNQLSKTKEYSYYLAYRTVEKVGLLLSESVNEGFLDENAYNDEGVLKKLLPKAYAAELVDLCPQSSGYYNVDLTYDSDNPGPESSFNMTCEEAPCKTNYIKSENNSRVCCKKATGHNSNTKYYVVNINDSSGEPVTCISNSDGRDFNPHLSNAATGFSGDFCPQYSIYNPQNGTCECMTGKGKYKDDLLASCEAPALPITTAVDFCKVIADNMSVIESKNSSGVLRCDNPSAFNGGTISNFTRQNLIYKGVLLPSPTSATSHTMNSILAYKLALDANKTSTFGKGRKTASTEVEPDIIFSSGMKLWILGDRVASIPGLTYTPVTNKAVTTSTTATNNIMLLNKCVYDNAGTQNPTSKCTGGTKYYCASEKHCYSLAATDYTVTNPNKGLIDARNCCGKYVPNSADAEATTIAMSGFTIYVDIDGNKGPGTLWDDVYPFYVTLSGMVFPAYPMDAPTFEEIKDENGNVTHRHAVRAVGGNSAAYLTTDVYYFKKGRKRVVEFQGLSYAEAVCRAGIVSKYAPYCLNLKTPEENESNKLKSTFGVSASGECATHRCYVTVRKKNSLI